MMAFLHPCAPPWLSLMAGRCSIEEIHRGQQGTPAVTLPHRRDGLPVLWMAVLCPFRRPSLCCPVHCVYMRSEVLDMTTIMPATPRHQRNYVEAYSRFMSKNGQKNAPAITNAHQHERKQGGEKNSLKRSGTYPQHKAGGSCRMRQYE